LSFYGFLIVTTKSPAQDQNVFVWVFMVFSLQNP